MSTNSIGALLKAARVMLGLTQRDLARRAHVSPRLWAEVERGERPNVSLETALRMLGEVGVSIRLTSPAGVSQELVPPGTALAARAARAAVRRATWQGRQLTLADEGTDEPHGLLGPERIAAVSQVSARAFAIAGAPAAPSSTRSSSHTRR